MSHGKMFQSENGKDWTFLLFGKRKFKGKTKLPEAQQGYTDIHRSRFLMCCWSRLKQIRVKWSDAAQLGDTGLGHHVPAPAPLRFTSN